MPKINILSKQTAELIAAGEVVERPASVVKELLENSIDAGATAVTLEIKSGGIEFIRITDNGCGIAREDVKKAFLSHATSKIASPDDLGAIMTLGFRGEALASIAAVARVQILTCTKDEDAGTVYYVEGGEALGEPDDAGCPKGTTIIVRDLFFNTPARMKFLKKDVSEANAVAGVADRVALSHPEVSFRFIRDGKETLFTPGDGKTDSAIYAVFGKDFMEGLLPAEYDGGAVKAQGFVSKPTASRPNRSMQFFFLNGRLIKTGTGSAALTEAYRNTVMVGKFPSCVISLTVPPHSVDVNVHPAKIEVRFSDEKAVFNAVYYCVKNALSADTSHAQHFIKKDDTKAIKNYLGAVAEATKSEQIKFDNAVPKKNDNFWVNQPIKQQPEKEKPKLVFTLDDKTREGYAPEQKRENDFLIKKPSEKQAEIEIETEEKAQSEPQEIIRTETEKIEPPKPEIIEPEIPDFTVIGEAFKTYILVQSEEKILVIDKHAAHERILFEQLKAQQNQSERQLLLEPVTVTLSKEDYSAAIENGELFESAGFVVEDFGKGTVIVTECPMLLAGCDIGEIVEELAGYLAQNKTLLVPEKTDHILHTAACRAAIKAGDFTSDFEMKKFTEKLLQMPEIRCCPHGRPVMIELTRRELEKSFGRI